MVLWLPRFKGVVGLLDAGDAGAADAGAAAAGAG